jgi:hypothetical protein
MSNITKEANSSSLFDFEHSKYTTWSAIFLGALIAFGLSFLIDLLSVSLGASFSGLNIKDLNEKSYLNYIIFFTVSIIVFLSSGFTTGKLIHKKNGLSNDILTLHANTKNINNVAKDYLCSQCIRSIIHGFAAWVIYLIISLHFSILLLNLNAQASPMLIAQPNSYEQQNITTLQIDQIDFQPNNIRTSEKMNVIIFTSFLINALSFSTGSVLGHIYNLKRQMKNDHVISYTEDRIHENKI